jgi:hypothetical protein
VTDSYQNYILSFIIRINHFSVKMTSARKETHSAYTSSFKLKVISVAETRGKHFASKHFNVDRKRVREWCKTKSEIEMQAKSAKRSTGAGRPVRYMDIEEKLMKWFSERRDAGVRVTGKALKCEALRLHKEGGSQSFKASNGWFTRFKKRHHISFRRTTHITQKSVEVTDDLVDRFLRFVIRMRNLREYEDCEIGNMDETPVYLEMPGKSTYEFAGNSEVSVTSTGRDKMKLTVTLGAYADGTKMSPLVHLPGVRPLPKTDIPSGIIVYMCGAGQKSWANEESILFWLTKIWGRNNQRRRMIVWDAFRAHITSKVKEVVKKTCNTDMCVIPGGCTSRLQPADVSWNKPFKVKLAELYDEWLFEGPVDKTKQGNRRAPPKSLVLTWIKEAWSCITPEMIRKSFKKCGITSALDGSDDHLFGQESGDEVPQSESEPDAEFEGFSTADVEIAEQVLDNVEISESDGECSSVLESADSATDYDSPGH